MAYGAAYFDKFRPPSQDHQAQFAWWEAAPKTEDYNEEYVEAQRAGSLISCAQRLESAQREVHEQNLWACQLYSNRELSAFDWGTGQLYRASLAPISRTGENITVRVVDTMVSQIGKNRPKPKPTPRGADFTCRQQIRRLDKFLYGEWQRNSVYALGKVAYRDACIFGFGCLKVACETDPEYGDRVCYERVFPDEILVDQMEIVACGKIRHFYRRRALPIEVVAATYDVSEEELRELSDQQATFSYLDYRPVGQGWIVVVEGYQVGNKQNPGRWMVATQNTVLDEGEWPHDWLPYVWYHANVPVSGFYSPSIVEQVLPYQIRLNEINEVIRDAQDIMSRPRVLVASGSQVSPMEIDNVPGRFVKYSGIKPEAIVWPAMNAEIYNERDRLVKTCLEQFGLSNLASTVTPPPGARFDSSPAFREFNAIQDDRLSDPAQRFEEFYRELAQRTTQVIAASGKNPTTTWYSGYKTAKAETIEWEELQHDSESYIMTMEMTSLYSMSPAAARDELEKQLAMGLISPEQYRMELADPDQESEMAIQAAAAEDLVRVQELLESGEFEVPTPEQDLVNGVQRLTLALLNLNKYQGVPASVKMGFINWITMAKAILQQGTEEEQMPNTGVGPVSAMAPPQQGQGAPMPGMMAPTGALPGPGPAPAGLAGLPAGNFAGPPVIPIPEAAGLTAPGHVPHETFHK